MPNYRSLTGGFFSATPMDKSSGPVSVRMNNPGAVNGAKWEQTYPGYVDTVETTPGNRSTIFESPEHGIAVWWQLMHLYRAAGAITPEGIINRYGGGQDYSAYLRFVLKRTGFDRNTVIDLDNDQQLLKFGSAMFRYEAGRELPWSDNQILFGIRSGREFARTGQWPSSIPVGPVAPGPVAAQASSQDTGKLLQTIFEALAANAAKPAAMPATTMATTTAPATSGSAAPPILSPIDKMFGGEALAGKKTAIAVIAYVVVAILKAVGVLGAATPAGQILSVLTIGFGALGGLSKVDRVVQSLGIIAAKAK
jgi:hypothetical protein